MENEDLNDLSIFALRNFARKVGVKSPTSKTKAQIIQEINEIKSGIREPSLSSKPLGRPPKNADLYVQSSEVELKREVVFNQPKIKFEYTSENNIIDGYVEIVNTNSSVLWHFENNNFLCYYIPSEVSFITPIKTGDFVICELQTEDRQLVVKKVLNINGVPINKFDKSRSDYNKIASILPEQKLMLSNSQLYVLHGENVYITGANSNLKSISGIELLNNLENCKKIYINIAMLEKNLIYLNNLKNAELFVAKFTDKISYIKQILNLAIEHAKRQMENKKNVVVLLDDLSSLIENAELEEYAKSIISLARATKRSGSITVFSIVDENTKYKKFADSMLKVLEDGNFLKLNI